MDFFTIVRTNRGTIAWSGEQVAYIIDEYINKGTSLAELGRRFKCSPAALRYLIRKKGYQLQGQKRGYPRDEYAFHNIDSAEKAYWLGFMYADGCVHSKTNEISINSKDKEHIEKFKKFLKSPNHKIQKVNDNRWQSESICYYFGIKDRQLHDDLIKWGCIPNKSLLLTCIPNIPRDYVSHFIRGYFDGDGSLHYLKKTNNYRISFSGTVDFLKDIRKELHKENLSIRQQKNNVPQLQIAGRKQVINILNYMYKDSTKDTRLDRKYALYLDCLKWVRPD